MKRKCSVCRQMRTTTNKEEIYVCEPLCLRITARGLLLNWKTKLEQAKAEGKSDYKGTTIILTTLAFLVGIIVAKLLSYIF